MKSQFRRHDSLIPKSFAIWAIGASPVRATATTSSRNSLGWGFGMVHILPAGPRRAPQIGCHLLVQQAQVPAQQRVRAILIK